MSSLNDPELPGLDNLRKFWLQGMNTHCVLHIVALQTVLKLTSALLIHVEPQELSLTVGEDQNVRFFTTDDLPAAVDITLIRSESFDGTPHIFQLDNNTRSAKVVVTGLHITSYAVLEVEKCSYVNSTADCPFTNLDFAFATVKVVHSRSLSIAVVVVGWVYFFAWSISFYPQIYLNFKRKSVVGLNFDFLLLNIIGFTCYTFYNVLMYFDTHVQEIYERSHPHSLIPVLLNDVVFAAHALLACLVTALQCFLYKRGNQRISYTCWGLSSLFALVAVVCLILTIVGVMNALQFIMSLSYIKMAVTLCKYFPQAFMNFRRKSTVGWSIGNVLLDFLGGSMDIIQMILQGANTDDWSVFYGNPVKFGLGMVSMVFDVLFMVQHYCLYRSREEGPPLRASEEGTVDEAGFSDSSNASILPGVIRVGEHDHTEI